LFGICRRKRKKNNRPQYRLKGITQKGLDHEISKYDHAFELFESLAKGNTTKFIMNPDKNKPMFEYTNTGVHTRKCGAFIREVKF